MRKHLVLVGGGHAHMVTLENISQFVERGYKVTVIAPADFHYYSGMGPGMLGNTYAPEDIRFATKQVVAKQGGIFVKDRVTRIDPDKKLVFTQKDHQFSYDVLSFNAGSYVPMVSAPEDSETIYPVKPIERLMEASERLKLMFREKNAPSVWWGRPFIGGGGRQRLAAGPPDKGVSAKNSDFCGEKFMARFPDTIRQRILSVFRRRDIEIIEAGYVKTVGEDKITLETGVVFDTNFVFMALGVKPSTLFEASGLPMGPDKGLRVNQYLQSVAYPQIFGGGDCIYFEDQPLDKVGVYAVRQNPVLLHNLMASLDGRDLEPFDPGPDYLLIFNLGGRTGILRKNKFVFGGRLAFMIKDYIDRKFIRRFQAIEKS